MPILLRHHPTCLGQTLANWPRKDWRQLHWFKKPKSPRIFRSATLRNSAPGATGVAARPPKAPAEKGCTTVGVQEAPHPATTGTNKVNVRMHNLNVQKMSCTPVLSLPQSPAQHLQVLMSRLDQIDCQSLTRTVLQLEYTDTGQVGSANSARVHDRFYPDTLPILPTPTDSNITSWHNSDQRWLEGGLWLTPATVIVANMLRC